MPDDMYRRMEYWRVYNNLANFKWHEISPNDIALPTYRFFQENKTEVFE